MHVLLQYQSKSYYIIGQEVYYSIGRFYYIIGQLLQYRAFLLHYRSVITVSGVYYIIGWYRAYRAFSCCQTNIVTAHILEHRTFIVHVVSIRMTFSHCRPRCSMIH